MFELYGFIRLFCVIVMFSIANAFVENYQKENPFVTVVFTVGFVIFMYFHCKQLLLEIIQYESSKKKK